MSIICKICNKEFDKIIPWQHLKHEHSISNKEYKTLYGDTISPETKSALAKRVPHNKGTKLSGKKLEDFRNSIKKREEKYKSGVLTKRGGTNWTNEQKEHLSKKSKEYASAHSDIMSSRTKKAIETKIKNGYDFSSPMKGKQHSEQTKEKISSSLKKVTQNKTITSHEKILSNIEKANLTLQSDLSSVYLELKCNSCNHMFSFTKQYFTTDKFRTTMCPVCYPAQTKISAKENEMFEFIQTLMPDAIQSYREKYNSKEIDVFVPSLNLGFEFNGLYWHSEEVFKANGRDPKHDNLKFQYFLKKGIRLIQIFEDEWDNHKDIVKSRISNILKNTSNVIYARKCSIQHITSSQASAFCKQTHIMGTGRSNIRLGLFFNDKLVSVMTFTKSNISRKSTAWEINRFSSLLNTSVVGGASKLFNAFIKEVDPDTVISYADNRWSNGGLYNTLGFTKVSNGTPNYWYTLPNTSTRIHRFNLRKNKSDNTTLTEYENRKQQGYNRIWDCGSSKWEWHKNKP